MTDQAYDGVERRKHARVGVTQTAVVLARFNSGVEFTIESISVGGARLFGPLTLEEGERVQILFEVDGHPIDVHAEVISIVTRSVDRDRVLVRFVDLAPDTAERIRAMIQHALEHEEDQLGSPED